VARAGRWDLSTTKDGEQVGRLRRAVDRIVHGHVRFRSVVGRNSLVDVFYRVAVGVVGLAVVALGIIALPAPGPGWAIIFLGLGILATEFERARRVLRWVRARYLAWVHWLGRQTWTTRLVVSAGILLLVAVCAWFVGVFVLIAGWLGIGWPWLQFSPVTALFGL
jgi:uncharacterized protein (TIGR02611 family)